MDYSKFVRKDMPLAVPTQKRPPGKYASHPYPVMFDDEGYIGAATALHISTYNPFVNYESVEDYYTGTANPKDVILKDGNLRITVDETDCVSGWVDALDIVTKGIFVYCNSDNKEGYAGSAKAMNVKITNSDIHYRHESNEYLFTGISIMDIKLT